MIDQDASLGRHLFHVTQVEIVDQSQRKIKAKSNWPALNIVPRSAARRRYQEVQQSLQVILQNICNRKSLTVVRSRKSEIRQGQKN
ncbi:hypothetical protein NKH82_32830 [Mesorhizobium sp. M0915]|uniref:hypothetical protein n=1 Tax=Mesorhizobium sp. M0915 TaxID=2957027 RepID=UPI00333AEC4D